MTTTLPDTSTGAAGAGRPARAARAPRAGGTSALGEVSLVDLLDRLLGAGVVVSGDVVISLAGVDLVQVRLHALITSVRAALDEEGS